MKKIYSFLLFLAVIGLSSAQAQLSVLFVDDSTDGFGNAENFHAALDSVGYPADYWNAADSTAGPSDLVMAEYDLVVWHTSSIDNTLYLWDALDTDNAALEAYLDGGGKLWVSGNDFLFDRYGAPPVGFAAGDFAYDYLGLSSLDVQSYGDDGATGVPLVDPATDSPVAGLNTLTWMFATLWWADGVSLVDENASAVYVMGDANYVLADQICASYYDNGTFTTLAYYFDLALANNFDLIKANVEPVMMHFESLISGTDELPAAVQQATIFPNPSKGPVSLRLELEEATRMSISLVDAQGRQLQEMLARQTLPAGANQLDFDLPQVLANGMYYLQINVDGQSALRPVVLQR